MTKYSQGFFVPKNPEKVSGKQKIQYRSSWELTMMHFLDLHPNVINWASESISIPYRNPLTGKNSFYIPDFLVVYKDKHGAIKGELVEVKPKKETFMEAAKSRRDKAYVIVNTAKWTAAISWCKKHNLTFKVINEDSIYKQQGRK